ncbi:hypothetical protein C2G38_2169774 [Gigaspora rosea]|uniref:Uncharacterized protein n=1 Tax=Gigaspora rosea TaxID=44941 RepID=A0A397VPZ1_9GLOM|nr:hypothetical protein C2G38_2169774 [Gigaspora rosea]
MPSLLAYDNKSSASPTSIPIQQIYIDGFVNLETLNAHLSLLIKFKTLEQTVPSEDMCYLLRTQKRIINHDNTISGPTFKNAFAFTAKDWYEKVQETYNVEDPSNYLAGIEVGTGFKYSSLSHLNSSLSHQNSSLSRHLLIVDVINSNFGVINSNLDVINSNI